MAASNDQLQSLERALASAKLGYWHWDASSDLITLTDRAAEIFGIDPSRSLTRVGLRDLLAEPDCDGALGELKTAFNSGSDYEIEFRVRRPADGEVIWILARGAGDRANGQIGGMYGILEDITARKTREHDRDDEHRSLEILNRTGAIIGAELDLEKLVQAVTDAGVDLTHAKFGAFFYNVINAQGESYMLYTLSGVPREAFSSFPMPRNTAVFAPTFGGVGIVRSHDILKDSRYGKNDPHFGMPKGHLPVRSYLAAPVMSRSGEVLGGLFFGHPETGVFDERAETILLGISAQAGVAIDNSRLYRAAQSEARERRSAEAQYRVLIETLPQLVWTCLPDGECNHLSRQWFEFTGIPETEQLGFAWLQVIHPDDRARALDNWMGAVRNEHQYDVEYRIRRHDGVYRWHKGRATALRNEAGEVMQWFGTSTDIEDIVTAREIQANLRENLESEVRRQTRDLQESNNRLRAEAAEREKAEGRFQLLVDSVVDYAIFMLDPAGVVANWNTGAERIKGYKASEITGRHFSTFYTAADRDAGVPQRGLEHARQHGKFSAQGWRVRKDGSLFWASVVINAVRDKSGNLLGFAKVTRDITEWRDAQEALKKTQEQLAQSQKMESIGHLTGGVAHDFNNLLTIISGNLDILARSLNGATQDPTKLARLVENAQRGAQRAAGLTQRLLAFSRRAPLDPRPVDLGRVIMGMSDMLRRSLGEGVAIETVLSGGLWRVHVDPNQLEVAILNLAVNARDAMPDGGKLTIETANAYLDEAYAASQVEVVPGQYAVVCITDTGVGMTKDVVARAFEPFFTTKGIGHGTGLGLSQVYGFVKQSGGHVKIYTEKDEGTTVKIYLPRFTGDYEDDSQTEKRPPAKGAEPVLVVEDEPDVRAYSCETMRELGYTVFEASDAQMALHILDQRPEIKLLFTDVGLPGTMNGRQLADEAKRRRPHLRVLFTTGYARNAIVHDGRLDAGVQLITKPFTYDGLASKLRELLDTDRPACRVLLVEDEILIRMMAAEELEAAGIKVEESGTASEALQRLRMLRGEIDVVIVDIGLPDRRGDVLVSEMRSLYPGLAILFATGANEKELSERYRGASRVDFISKPYLPEALIAKIQELCTQSMGDQPT